MKISMKKLLLCLILAAGVVVSAHAEDRIRIQVQFKKGVFACPGGDEIVDWSPAGGNTYEHTCSDGTWLNQFTEYNGVIPYTPEEYANISPKEIAIKKQELVEAWDYDRKHPPEYIEPSAADYISMANQKMTEVEGYIEKIKEKGTKADLEVIQARLEGKTDKVKEDIKAK